jgi:hypothetical protein
LKSFASIERYGDFIAFLDEQSLYACDEAAIVV